MKTKQLLSLSAFIFIFCATTIESFSQWIPRAPMISATSARVGAVSWVIGTKAYVAGGGGTGNLQEYDPATNAWTIKAPVPWNDQRAFSVGFVINGKGYICTGQDANNNIYDDVWEYDPVTDSWASKMFFMGLPRTGAFGFSIGNKGYVIGGSDGSNVFNDVWEYDAIADAWTQKTDFGGIPNDAHLRVNGVGTSLNGFGFVGMGFGMDNSSQLVFQEYNDFWKYDPVNDSWTEVASMPGSPRENAVIAASATEIYVGTGHTNFVSAFNDFYKYNPLTNVWSAITNFTTGREAAVAFYLSGSLYFGTGSDLTNAFRDLWQLNFSTGFSELSGNNTFSVYPNPCSDYFIINSGKGNFSEVEVMNYSGEVIMTTEIDSHTHKIDASSWSSGLYFVRTKSAEGEVSLSKINIVK